ncbi:hypothetical protein [Gramella sp. AN32]|uniref:Uncharacterized protein n=1 Tax=Christiangramia antarctica TaxID=2058158 RepID=A0ABW5X894_9FLAO|nr:hypothetical protein [Gramella sp. AN32]MCM4155254.1 hypothetical protein [Gramella sp. AN32]
MKPKNLIFTLVLLFSLAPFTFIQAQNTHIIILKVKTAEVTKDNTSTTCYFEETQEMSNEDYTTLVEPGDFIIWKGESTSSDLDEVIITSINYHGGHNVFGTNQLNESRDVPGTVLGEVQANTNGQEEKYIIKFKVKNNEQRRNGTFQIDPKIQVRTID